jgi:glycosyltransferase involved in cell wall biosynthesis
MKISVCIPCYEMFGRATEMLNLSFGVLSLQSFTDFEVIISDDSEDDAIKNLISFWKPRLNIKYIKNPNEKGLSSNLNNAIKHAKGEIIKVLCEDDFLFGEAALEITYNNFDFNKGWLVSSYYHTKESRKVYFKQQIPTWNDKIYLVNTIGTHSCLSFVNDSPLLFDPKLMWYMDCDYYYSLFLRYGEPFILKEPTVVQYLWEGQTTNAFVTKNIEEKERKYLIEKYE